jgi:hypothetical protein
VQVVLSQSLQLPQRSPQEAHPVKLSTQGAAQSTHWLLVQLTQLLNCALQRKQGERWSGFMGLKEELRA